MSVDLSSITDTHLFSRTSSSSGKEYDDYYSSSNSPLYGRTNESKLLLDAYQSVVDSGKSRVLLIHGPSGVGKTSLVETALRQSVSNSNGYFCAGKFFNHHVHREPYSALVAAFSDLCELIQQSDDFEKRRRKIQKELGLDGRLLSKVVSSLSPFVVVVDDDDSEESPTLPTTTSTGPGGVVDIKNELAFAKFKVSCKKFLNVMPSKDHPVVLFIDDIQWADEGSRQVIRMLLQDTGLKNVLIVLAYREEEAKAANDMFRGIDLDDGSVIDIRLENMDKDHVFELISAGMECTSPEVRQLSDLVALKTGGNPFYVRQFIETIQTDGLLLFDPDNAVWVFDVDEIQRTIMVSNSLALLLARKIDRIPNEVQQTLKVAALLGFHFNENILYRVRAAMLSEANTIASAESAKSVDTSLSVARRAGFVEKTSSGHQFSHDMLLTAFQDMFNDEEKERLHFVIGETYLTHDSAEDAIYQAAVHLNNAPGIIQEPRQKAELARYNVEASKYCRDKSAFLLSANLLEHGLGLLDTEVMWSENFDLAFEITESLAKVNLINGNFDACKKRTSEVLLHAHTFEMKSPALIIGVEVRMAGMEVDESILCANEGVRSLGFKLPQRANMGQIFFKLLKIKCLMIRMTDEDILSLPTMEDRKIIATVKMLLEACWCGFANDDEVPAIYAALSAFELTLKHGLSRYSASCITLYGITELGTGNKRRAYRFGKLALKMIDHFKCKETECDTISTALTLLLHWKETLKELTEPLDRGLESALECGEYLIGSFCLSNCFAIKSYQGMNLQELEAFVRINYARISEMGTDSRTAFVQPPLQFVLNLQSTSENWRDLTILTGEAMNEAEFIKEAVAGNHAVILSIFWMMKFQLAYYFGFYSMAESALREMESVGKANRHHFNFTFWQLFGGLTHYQLYRDTGRRFHLKTARRYKKALQRLHAQGCPNIWAALAFLEAEELSAKCPTKVIVLIEYERAIDAMKELQWVHLEGLANERLAFHLAKLNRFEDASDYFDEAMRLYRDEWGSHARYQWLEEMSQRVLSRREEQPAFPHVGGIIEIEPS